MPTIEENLRWWNEKYDWSQKGEKWSASWGGSETQWYASIFPRIHAFLPAHSILEIAPGYGRWTEMIKAHCEKLIVVDLADSCIEACKKRFHKDTHISYHLNDGKSLAMLQDATIDFAFSFDSLVHAEADVIDSYLAQLARKLTPNGVGFFHHSNIGVYVDPSTGELPDFLDNTPGRATSMTARRFTECCSAVGLRCIAQELINWETSTAITDCFSLFTRRDSHWARPNRVLINKRFAEEASYLRKVMLLYVESGYRPDPIQWTV
ncbi:MAG: class I SAM-dependent methyltransferase [Cyanobacteria bacterium]|nr:class I SAM-dependent methyltransferase [Cyanobacteriota bacterium]